ncbi:MAG: hypothetical protein R2710_12085 [Acidimicrobiales bacterium]
MPAGERIDTDDHLQHEVAVLGQPGPAGSTTPARSRHAAEHSLADEVAGHVVAEGDDPPNPFMTEPRRSRQLTGDPRDKIGPTDPATIDLDDDTAGCRFGFGERHQFDGSRPPEQHGLHEIETTALPGAGRQRS